MGEREYQRLGGGKGEWVRSGLTGFNDIWDACMHSLALDGSLGGKHTFGRGIGVAFLGIKLKGVAGFNPLHASFGVYDGTRHMSDAY